MQQDNEYINNCQVNRLELSDSNKRKREIPETCLQFDRNDSSAVKRTKLYEISETLQNKRSSVDSIVQKEYERSVLIREEPSLQSTISGEAIFQVPGEVKMASADKVDTDKSKLYIRPCIDMRNVNITKINSELDIAIQSKSLLLSEKLKISLVLVERMTPDTVQLIYSKVKLIGVLGDVMIKLLNEAREVSLNEPKRMFLVMCSLTHLNTLNYMLRRTLTDYSSSIVQFVDNTLDCVTEEYIDTLVDTGKYESLLFNIMRKTTLSNIRDYIYNKSYSFKNSGLKMLLKKEYEKIKQHQ